jgi:SNF2 family DNA or RNA helicase
MASVEEKYKWFMQKSGCDFKEYQFQGVQWLVNRENPTGRSLIRGGFIADEMGLGKTIMMISTFICNLLPKTLIVLPNILLEQWTNEIFRTTGHKVLIFHGPDKKKITIEQIKNATIVLTTYTAIAINKTKNKYSLLHQIKWNRVVFDEAHHLRNKNSRHFGAIFLKSDIRWLISGTPVQNKRRDFINLCKVLNIDSKFVSTPENITIIVNLYVLKRTKKQVGIDLPQIKTLNLSVNWNNNNERKMSHSIHSLLQYSGPGKLPIIIRARQMCILPAMLKKQIPKMIDNSIISHDFRSSDATSYSSKIDAFLSTILERKDNGNGKLVFCHFREEIDFIVFRLKQAGILNVCAFDGRILQNKRLVQLSSQFTIIVLQIQTGCEGLNLQKDFNEIYFISPNWNPAIEDQAVARCHRIGQLKEVHVFRFHMNQLQDSSLLDSCKDLHYEEDQDNDSDNEDQNHSLDQYISRISFIKREVSRKIFNG